MISQHTCFFSESESMLRNPVQASGQMASINV